MSGCLSLFSLLLVLPSRAPQVLQRRHRVTSGRIFPHAHPPHTQTCRGSRRCGSGSGGSGGITIGGGGSGGGGSGGGTHTPSLLQESVLTIAVGARTS